MKKVLALSVFVLTVLAWIAEPALATERGAPGLVWAARSFISVGSPRLVGTAAVCAAFGFRC